MIYDASLFQPEDYERMGLHGEKFKLLLRITDEHLVGRGFTASRDANSYTTTYTRSEVGLRIEVQLKPGKRAVIVTEYWPDRDFAARTVFENYSSRSRLVQLLGLLSATE